VVAGYDRMQEPEGAAPRGTGTTQAALPRENGLIRRVDLEAQLSSPSVRLQRLLGSWRSLPADEPSRTKSTPRRRRQRAEDRLGPDGVAQLVADYQAGIATTRLMQSYGLGKGAVLRLLDSHGVTRRRQPLTPAEVQEAIRLYGQGWSLARIGQRFGRHHSVILRALDRARGPRRNCHGREP
jgi:helix-turn-helix protein